MAQSVGRAVLVGFIWLFGLKYYIECSGFSDPSEKMTISTVFWVFTGFTILELCTLFRGFSRTGGRKGSAGELFRGILKDRRSHLAALTLLYLILIPVLGFFTASFLSFAAFSFVLGTRGFWRILLPDIFVLASIYVIFSVMLKLTLPSGIFL